LFVEPSRNKKKREEEVSREYFEASSKVSLLEKIRTSWNEDLEIEKTIQNYTRKNMIFYIFSVFHSIGFSIK
jgi:hypothetical protein